MPHNSQQHRGTHWYLPIPLCVGIDKRHNQPCHGRCSSELYNHLGLIAPIALPSSSVKQEYMLSFLEENSLARTMPTYKLISQKFSRASRWLLNFSLSLFTWDMEWRGRLMEDGFQWVIFFLYHIFFLMSQSALDTYANTYYLLELPTGLNVYEATFHSRYIQSCGAWVTPALRRQDSCLPISDTLEFTCLGVGLGFTVLGQVLCS